MRLIDADALILALKTQDYSGSPESLEDWTPQDMTKAEIADINNAPTIDAEPVIRCKDCKWFGTHTGWKGNRFSVCRNVDGGMAYIKAYDYCSRAESKDG